MTMNRRRFISTAVIMLGALSCPRLFADLNAQEVAWSEVCKRWMNKLMPSDVQGPGADAPVVWEQLHELMAANTEKQANLLRLFGALATVDEGVHPGDIAPESDLYGELHQLQLVFCELYYGSVVGAGDIGLDKPPQPFGYLIEL